MNMQHVCFTDIFQPASKPKAESKAVVPRGSRAMAPRSMPGPVAMRKEQGMLIPEGNSFKFNIWDALWAEMG